MRTRLRAVLTSAVNPSWFALTYLLLVSVLFSAKLMVDELEAAEDGAAFYFQISNRYPWLAVD